MERPKLPIQQVKDDGAQRAFRQVEEWLKRAFISINDLQINGSGGITYDVFTALVDGLVPAPSTPSGRVLSDDGTWVALPVDTGEVNTASNVGAGAGLFKQKTLLNLEFKTLVAGTGITLTPAADSVTVAATTAGEANTASNVGAGAGLFKQKTLLDLEFKTLVAGSNVTLTAGASSVTIAATDTGEVNTSSNTGSGAQLAKTKSGVDLPFRSIVGGSGITVTQNTDDVTVDSDALVVGVGLGIFGTAIDGSLVFDGTTTVLGIVPSTTASTTYRLGVVKQYVLTRDLNCDNLQIDSGVLVFMDGYRVFVKGTLTLNGYLGQPGTNGAAGQQLARTATVYGTRLVGNGTPQSTPGSSAVAPTGASNSGGGLGANGGVGGPGSNGGAGIVMKGGGGGGGGNVTAGTNPATAGGTITLQNSNQGSIDNLFQAITGREIAMATRFTAATGGGHGCNAGLTSVGFGGGGGAPFIVIARLIVGSGQLISHGGNGNANSTVSGGGGGGGGGCWGVVVISNGSFPTNDASGGSGGTGTAGGGFTSGTGGAGGPGFVKSYRISI